MGLGIAGRVAGSMDPASSDLGLHCFLRLPFPIFGVDSVYRQTIKAVFL